MPYGNQACVPQLPSLCSRAQEPQLRNTCATTTVAPHPRVHVPQREKAKCRPCLLQLQEAHTQQ